MFRKSKCPIGSCARCGKGITDKDWIKYCESYIILSQHVILHFCKSCFGREKE